MSHRGGLPGFVRVMGPEEIMWADYTGMMLMRAVVFFGCIVRMLS